MTTLYEHLQELKKEALKQKDSRTFTSLGTILGEAKQVATKKENRDPTDEEIVTVVRKGLEGIAERLKYEKDEVKRGEIVIERDLLQKFIPTQLSETEINVIIRNSGLTDMKSIMQLFKEKYHGKYDGKQVSDIVKGLLATAAVIGG